MAYTDIHSEDRLVQATFAEPTALGRNNSGMAYPLAQRRVLEHT